LSSSLAVLLPLVKFVHCETNTGSNTSFAGGKTTLFCFDKDGQGLINALQAKLRTAITAEKLNTPVPYEGENMGF